jgi:hypothetical protein
MRLYTTIKKIELTLSGYSDSAIGDISLWKIGLFIDVIESAAKTIINLLLIKGIDIKWIIKNVLGISFLEFEKMTMTLKQELI